MREMVQEDKGDGAGRSVPSTDFSTDNT